MYAVYSQRTGALSMYAVYSQRGRCSVGKVRSLLTAGGAQRGASMQCTHSALER